jgi:adenine-specific DNA-methyltransferase
MSTLPRDVQHYWIGTFYTLLLPAKARREQAAYFTPPYLAEAVIDLAIDAGFDPARQRVLDPAAGGAAFLSTIVGRKLRLGLRGPAAALDLHGIEIDAGLALISRALVADKIGGPAPRKLITVRDALSTRPRACYDLVVANPPYGRITPGDLAGNRWEKVSYSGHINKYAVFVDFCLQAAKKGGIVALVIPSSFRAGPLYDLLRRHIRAEGEVLAIGTVAGREGVFADVEQDVSVVVVRKGKPHSPGTLVNFPVLPPPLRDKVRQSVLPSNPRLPWSTPGASDRYLGGACLDDYGVTARVGYLVWNRERERLITNARRNAYPLIWAKNIRAGRLCTPAGKNGDEMDFVMFDGDSQAIVRTPAAVLQRTTNDQQPRRLIAALVEPGIVRKWGGFVTENHTIVLTSKTFARLRLVVTLLNTKEVDDRYRKVSGTAAISVTLLRSLDLPPLDKFRDALKSTGGDAEAAAKLAYSSSALRKGSAA